MSNKLTRGQEKLTEKMVKDFYESKEEEKAELLKVMNDNDRDPIHTDENTEEGKPSTGGTKNIKKKASKKKKATKKKKASKKKKTAKKKKALKKQRRRKPPKRRRQQKRKPRKEKK